VFQIELKISYRLNGHLKRRGPEVCFCNSLPCLTFSIKHGLSDLTVDGMVLSCMRVSPG
jgi:hypothetical protein